MKTARPELRFERLLAALERDLLDATDQEILDAANELGMQPTLQGSAALFGVTFTMKLGGRAAARMRSQNLQFTETSILGGLLPGHAPGHAHEPNAPRTRSRKSSGSTTSSRARRRSKRGTPPSE